MRFKIFHFSNTLRKSVPPFQLCGGAEIAIPENSQCISIFVQELQFLPYTNWPSSHRTIGALSQIHKELTKVHGSALY